MCEHRNVPAERAVDLRLPERVVEVIVAADDVADRHVMVVDDDGEVVSRRAVGAQDDEIIELLIGDRDAPLHAILDHRLTGLRRLQANDRRDPGRGGLGIAIAPAAVITDRAALGAGFLAHRLGSCGVQKQ